jgi:hypothetical protein
MRPDNVGLCQVKRLRADVSKRFVTFQHLSGDPGGGTKPYKNAVQKGHFSFPAV